MNSNVQHMQSSGNGRWLALFCTARMAFSLIFTAYSAVLPLVIADWSMSAAQAGLIQSAWHLGYLVSLFAVGFLGDRFGAKRTFLASGVAASLSALAFAILADGFLSGVVLYGLAGLCSGGSYTPGLVLIAERIEAGRRGRAMGFYLAAASLGYALSMVLSSQLLGLGGWRLSLLVCGALPAVGLILSVVALRGTPNLIHAEAGGPGLWKATLQVVRNRPAMLSMWAYTFHCWELMGMWAWLPAFLAQAAQLAGGSAGGGLELGLILSGLTHLTSMGGSFLGGALSDRIGRTLTMAAFSVASMAFSFTLGWAFAWPLAVLFVLAALYNLCCIADSSVYSTALTELAPPPLIGAAYAVRSVMGFGAGMLSPWVFGLVYDLARTSFPGQSGLVWGLAWMSLGLGALPGPIFIRMLRVNPQAVQMARGLR